MKREPLDTAAQRSFLMAKFSAFSEVCSLDRDEPSTCPFQQIREMGHEGSVAWINTLSDEAVLNIYTFCQHCFEGKRHLKEPNQTPLNVDTTVLIEARKHGRPSELAKK